MTTRDNASPPEGWRPPRPVLRRHCGVDQVALVCEVCGEFIVKPHVPPNIELGQE